VCGDLLAAKFSVGSDWCANCAAATLAEQAQLDRPVQDREIIDTLVR
jgi:hypothetical protein